MRDRAPGAARLLSGPVTMASVLAGLAPAFSPDSSDGGYEGAREAPVQGVIAAKDEARSLGHDQLRIGFNGRPRATRHRAAARVRVSHGRVGRLKRRYLVCAGRG